jgi:hypothetical protein
LIAISGIGLHCAIVDIDDLMPLCKDTNLITCSMRDFLLLLGFLRSSIFLRSAQASTYLNLITMKVQLNISLLALVALSSALPADLDTTASNVAKSTHDVEAITYPLSDAAVPAVANPTLKGFLYLGCKSDSRAARVLSQNSMYLQNMTLSACGSFCSGYQYFGTEYKSECYCGNTILPTSVSVGEPDCWMKCSGSNETCGGNDRVSLFKSTTWVPPASAPKEVSVPGYAFRGCYVDKVGDRTLKGPYLFDGNLTTTKCAGFCNGSTYFGTEYGGECYCAPTIPAQAKEVDASECSVACKGNKAQACGGGNRLSVYWKIPGL